MVKIKSFLLYLIFGLIMFLLALWLVYLFIFKIYITPFTTYYFENSYYENIDLNIKEIKWVEILKRISVDGTLVLRVDNNQNNLILSPTVQENFQLKILS